MNTIGKISLALTLLLTGALLAMATNTHGSKGATLILVKQSPARHAIYQIPAAPESEAEKGRVTPGTTATTSTEDVRSKEQKLLAPLHLSRHALQTASILLFGLGVTGMASVYRKRRV